MKKHFTVKRALNLGFLGEGWDKCVINFRPFSYREVQDMQTGIEDKEESARKFLTLLKSHFIDGQGLVDGASVSIEASDIEDLPLEVITEASKVLTGQLDPK